MRRLRVGVVAYLNTKPLSWALEAGLLPEIEVVGDVPSALGGLVQAGELDTALLSAILATGEHGLHVIPGTGCVAAHGPIQSVQLFCRVPLAQVRSVALDTSSLCAAGLTRVLFAQCWQIEPTWHQAAPDLPAMLAAHDAALVIGDPGLARYLSPGAPAAEIIDLGQAWYEWTGLPFVFAAWLTKRPLDSLAELVAVLQRARQLSSTRLATIAAEEARRLGLPEEFCHTYLTKVVHYEFGPAEAEGLAEFGDCLARLPAPSWEVVP